MVVYEATKKKDYKKIANFMQSQPSDSVWLRCFMRGRIRKKTVEFLEFVKKQISELRIFYIEDEKGNVRAVEILETRGALPKEPKIVTNVVTLPDEEPDARLFQLELMREVAERCLKEGYHTAEFVIREMDLPYLHPDAEIVRDFQFPFDVGKGYLCRIDLKKFLGAT